MDAKYISVQELKQLRPDLYQAIKQEACLGELRLTKDDIISMIDPLSENIKEHLKPYLSKLSTMTYNDIVDMENDIIDEISEQLLYEFEEIESIVKGEKRRKTKRVVMYTPIKEVVKPASIKEDTCKLDLHIATLEDLKRHRPDLCNLLHDEFQEVMEPASVIEDTCILDLHIATLEDLKKHRPDLCDLLFDDFLRTYYLETPTTKPVKPNKEVTKTVNGVKKGDAIRWNYTKEEGIVVGFENEDGISNIIVQCFDGTKILFENDPKLFTILEGEEKAKVISERERYVAESQERKNIERTSIPKKTKKSKTIYDGIVYNEPTRRGSKVRVGDTIQFKMTKDTGRVSGFIRIGGLDRIVLGSSTGLPQYIIDNPNAYEIIEKGSR